MKNLICAAGRKKLALFPKETHLTGVQFLGVSLCSVGTLVFCLFVFLYGLNCN